jgi:DNA-binding response OmpR family regulator
MNVDLDISQRAARVLIVDDSPDTREILQIMLNWDGFVTLTASSGEEALATAAEQRPDVILLDFVLPGLSGCEVTVRMKGNLGTKDIPIMIVSGMSDSATRKRALSAGAEDFITKPVNRFELCQRVRNILRLETAAVGLAETKVAAGSADTHRR